MADYVKIPELFNYDKPKVEEYHSPRLSTSDKTLLAIYEALNAADWSQSISSNRGSNALPESSIRDGGSAEIIGRHPSNAKISALMGGQAIGVPYIISKLPEKYRAVVLAMLIFGKANAVKNNASLGVDVIRW